MIWLAVAMANESLPTPYTAEQIQDAFPVGTVLEFELDEAGSERRSVWKVEAADAESVTFSFDGVRSEPAKWESLRLHASFPSDQAERTEAKLTTALGELDCWHYVVQGEPRKDYWFSKAHPGPPVLMTATTAAGVEVLRMEQVVRK